MENKVTAEKKSDQVIGVVISVLMCAEAFLLFFYHISNGKTDIVTAGFGWLYYSIPVVLTVLGIVQALRCCAYMRDFLSASLPILFYLAFRLTSGIANGLTGDPGFWKTVCYESFLLLGINAYTVSKKTLQVVMCGLLAFDLVAISICTYHFIYFKDSMASAVASFPAQLQGYIPFSYIFINPNLAGMLAGICASICILVFRGYSKAIRMLLAPVIIININFMLWAGSRTAVIGTAAVILICMLRRYVKRAANYKAIIAASLIFCACFMVPVYIMSMTSDPADHFKNTEMEASLNEKSSGRYNLWKSHILSQKGHYLLGFGTASKAVKARAEFMTEIGNSEDVKMDETYQVISDNTALGVHNGYMELVLVAGLPAAIILIAFILLKIRSMDNGYIERHPVVLLLVMLFWISVQESRFITSSVHYIAFLMMLLINWRDDEESETL